MRVKIMSRLAIEQYKSAMPWACISITSDNTDVNFNSENLVAIKRLSFLDVRSSHEYGCFTLVQAASIWGFIANVQDKIHRLVIHCDAGISRSPAIAAAIERILNNKDDSAYFKKYQPNKYVYDKMIAAYELFMEGDDDGRI